MKGSLTFDLSYIEIIESQNINQGHLGLKHYTWAKFHRTLPGVTEDKKDFLWKVL